ncbi:hypothetical protein [Bacillus sp. 205(2023)]|uniref:hypothetical protein n=1 Tax=Bacillus sp. 205(2023) TaxID=3096767 RepID=UPI00300872FB
MIPIYTSKNIKHKVQLISLSFDNAVNTAILMNSVSKHILNKEFSYSDIKCGIGIDYGKMLVTKTGFIKQNVENTSYKSLVWLGRPVNIASKLTDLANKTTTNIKTTLTPTINEGILYPLTDKWHWSEYSQTEFLEERIIETNSGVLKHKNKYFETYFLSTKTDKSETSTTTEPILITSEVYNGFKNECPDDASITKDMWEVKNKISVPGYSEVIYGGDIIFTSFENQN